MIIVLLGCYTNSLIDYNVQIMPSNKTSYSEGSHVIVTCIVSSAEPDHPPQWCKTVGSACTSVQGLPGVHQNLTTFNTNNCTWVSQLEIPDFDTSQTGQYFCYVSNTSVQQNITLQVTREFHDYPVHNMRLHLKLLFMKVCHCPMASLVWLLPVWSVFSYWLWLGPSYWSTPSASAGESLLTHTPRNHHVS